MSIPRWHLLCYDIRDERRLSAVHRFVRKHALCLQKSVYAWHGNDREWAQFTKRLSQLVQPAHDDLRGYPLPHEHCMHWWGQTPLPEGVMTTMLPQIKQHKIGESTVLHHGREIWPGESRHEQ